MPGPPVRPERYAAFLPLAFGILGAGLVGLNFGHYLFVPVAPPNRKFLSQVEAGADGQAAFCFPAIGQRVTLAQLVMFVIAD